MISNSNAKIIITDPTPQMIDNYYYNLSQKLPSNFYQQIVEKENEMNLTTKPNLKTIQELCILYKKAIESFSGVSPNKVQFFSNKLMKLVMYEKNMKKQKEDKKKQYSRFNDFINRRKEHVNQFKLFLEMDKAKEKITNIVTTCNDQIKKKNVILEEEEKKQDEKFMERKSKRKIRERKPSTERKQSTEINLTELNGKHEKVDNFIDDFLKKFHYVYMHSKLFETPIECLGNIFDEIYYHKIKKYYYYQEQIKQFQLLLGDEDGGQHQDSLEFYLKDLKTERENYFNKIETVIKETEEKIKEKCIQNSIDEDKKFTKYKDDLMNNITHVFK